MDQEGKEEAMTSAGKRFNKWTWSHRLCAVAFLVLLSFGSLGGAAWFRGSTSSSTAFDLVPFSDPLAALEVLLASHTLEITLLIGALLLVLLGGVMGPVFCGWVCPLGLLLDLNQGVRKLIARAFGNAWPHISLLPAFRYGVLGLVLGFSLVAGAPAFQTLSPINFMAWTIVFYPHDAVGSDPGFWPRCGAMFQSMIGAGGMLLAVLGFLLVLEYFASRLWCRALCPLGGLYGLIGRFAPFRVRVNRSAACPEGCERCEIYCPMDIAVKKQYLSEGRADIDALECTRCGDCIDACPRDVLRFGFTRSCFITRICCDRLQGPPAASSGRKRPQRPH
jgi:ferredoxin-type protein NapH